MTILKHTLIRLSHLACFFFCVGLLIFSGSVLYFHPKLPSVDTLRDIKLQTPLRIYSADEQLIAEFGEKRRDPVQLERVPQLMKLAILAAEDARFYEHGGIDFKGLARAAVELASTGKIRSGGSTITMQVAKNFFLTPEKSFIRKFREILLSYEIEKALTKDEILELYANKIYLGHRAYGLSAAAQLYYGKGIDEIELAQFAMLAGLPKAPSSNNPISNPKRALQRRDWILNRMLELQYITPAQHGDAKATPIIAEFHGIRADVEADYLAEMVRADLIERLGPAAYTDGYVVRTTLRSDLQIAAERALQKGLMDYSERHGYRGPEGHISLPPLSMETPDTSSEGSELGTAESVIGNGELALSEDAQSIISRALRTYNIVGPLHAAIVLHVSEQSVIAQLRDEQTIEITWDGLSWAAPYITANRMGAKPRKASDILKLGDIIRVYASETPEESAPKDSKTTQETTAPPNDDTRIIHWKLGQIPDAQSALISVNPDNGAVVSIVGGFDFRHSKFNRVVQAGRQPGSSFKPFIYSAALSNGFTAASVINDAPVVFQDSALESAWRPENSSGNFSGPTRLREALYRSRNLVSIRLLQQLSVSKALSTLNAFGFDTSRLPRDLSLALGSATQTPWDMARSYAILANGGYAVEPYIIETISDVEGNIIYQAKPRTVCRENCGWDLSEPQTSSGIENALTLLSETNTVDIAPENGTPQSQSAKPDDKTPIELPNFAPRVIDEKAVYIMHSMLKDVIKRGTGRRALSLKRNDIAGKTGTTNDQKDAWFSGFTPDMVSIVWVGFDSPATLGRREYGGTAALPIWIDFMATALADIPEKHMDRPEGIIAVRIDAKTGLRAPAGAEDTLFEIFREDQVPALATTEEAPTPYSDGEGDSLPDQLF